MKAVKYPALALVVSALITLPYTAVFGAWTDLTFVERTGLALLCAIPLYFVAQADWHEQARKRARRKPRATR